MGAPYPEDGPGVEIPLVQVEEQKVVGEEEDVDAQPGRLRGTSCSLVRDPSPGPPLTPHPPCTRKEERQGTAGGQSWAVVGAGRRGEDSGRRTFRRELAQPSPTALPRSAQPCCAPRCPSHSQQVFAELPKPLCFAFVLKKNILKKK